MRGFSRFRGILCVFMKREWQMLEYDLDTVGVLVGDFLESRTDSRAERSLKVAELDHFDHGAIRPPGRRTGR